MTHPASESFDTWANTVDAALDAHRATIADLRNRVDALEEGEPDQPVPPAPSNVLVSGPMALTVGDLGRGDDDDSLASEVWTHFPRSIYPPSPTEHHAQSAGNAPIEAINTHTIRAYLRAQDQVAIHGSATGTSEEHLPFSPTRKIRLSVEVRFVDTTSWPYDPGLTGKLGGVHSWDGDWTHFAGGGITYPDTCSFRFIQWNWNRRQWLFGAYLYLGGGLVQDVNVDVGSAFNHKSNGDRSGEWLFKSGPTPALNHWHRLVAVLDIGDPGSPNGTAEVYVDDTLALRLTDVPWTGFNGSGAWNHGYQVLGFGGGAGFEPQNERRGSIVDYRNFRIEAV